MSTIDFMNINTGIKMSPGMRDMLADMALLLPVGEEEQVEIVAGMILTIVRDTEEEFSVYED